MSEPKPERETDKGVGAETERRDVVDRPADNPNSIGTGRETTRDTGVGDTVDDGTREPRRSER